MHFENVENDRFGKYGQFWFQIVYVSKINLFTILCFDKNDVVSD